MPFLWRKIDLCLKEFGFWALVAFLNILNDDIGTNAAPSPPDRFQARPFRLNGRMEILEDFIGGRFKKDASVAKAMEVEFHGLEFDTDFIRSIAEYDCGIVWVPRHWTSGGKLLLNVLNRVVAIGVRIREGFDFHPDTLAGGF
jgi:hypothetical protein